MQFPKNIRGLTLVILLVLLVLAGLYYLLIDPFVSRVAQLKMGEMFSGSNTPDEIKDARYLLAPYNGGGLYEAGRLSYEDYATDGSIITDLAFENGVEAKIAALPNSDNTFVALGGKRIVTSSDTKRALTLSPDGTFVAYASRSLENPFAVHESWRVVVANEAGEVWETSGVAGLFLDSDTLAIFRKDGVYAVSMTSGIETKLSAETLFSPFVWVAVSEDRSRIAWSEQIGKGMYQTKAYDAVYNTAWALYEIVDLDSIGGPVAVTSGNLYALVERTDSTELVHYPLFSSSDQQAAVLRTFSENIAMTKILP